MITGRYALLFAALAAIVAATFVFALASGSASIAFSDAMRALGGAASDEVHALVIDLRLPRALTAFAVGGLLAVAGVLMQVLLRNPLAEPYILGTSGGAAVAALLAMLLGLSSLIVDLAAFGGALAATLLVFSIAHGTGSWTPTRLLLTGVVLAAGFSAATTLLLALSPAGRRFRHRHRKGQRARDSARATPRHLRATIYDQGQRDGSGPDDLPANC